MELYVKIYNFIPLHSLTLKKSTKKLSKWKPYKILKYDFSKSVNKKSYLFYGSKSEVNPWKKNNQTRGFTKFLSSGLNIIQRKHPQRKECSVQHSTFSTRRDQLCCGIEQPQKKLKANILWKFSSLLHTLWYAVLKKWLGAPEPWPRFPSHFQLNLKQQEGAKAVGCWLQHSTVSQM